MAQSSSSSGNETLSMKMILAGIRKRFSKVTNISTNEVQKAVNDGSATDERRHLLFDVREQKEFDVSHIADATFINESHSRNEKVEAVLKAVQDRMTHNGIVNLPLNVYIYCSIGYRSSALISEIVKDKEFEVLLKSNLRFYNMEGGIFQWANEGRPMVDCNNDRTHYVHPYNGVFGKLLFKRHRYQD